MDSFTNSAYPLSIQTRATRLTCKLHPGFSADDGSDGVGGYALVNAPVQGGLGPLDQQVPLHKAVVGVYVHVNVLAIELPPVGSGSENGREYLISMFHAKAMHYIFPMIGKIYNSLLIKSLLSRSVSNAFSSSLW